MVPAVFIVGVTNNDGVSEIIIATIPLWQWYHESSLYCLSEQGMEARVIALNIGSNSIIIYTIIVYIHYIMIIWAILYCDIAPKLPTNIV